MDMTSLPSLSVPQGEEEAQKDELAKVNQPHEKGKTKQKGIQNASCLPPPGTKTPSAPSSALTPPPRPALPHLPLIEQRWHPCWDSRYRRYYFWDTLTNTTTWESPVSTPLGIPDDPTALVPSSSPPSPTSAGAKVNQTGVSLRSMQQKEGEQSSVSDLGSSATDAKQIAGETSTGSQNRQHMQEQKTPKKKHRLQKPDANSSTEGHPPGESDREQSAKSEPLEEFSASSDIRGGIEKKKRRLDSNNSTSMRTEYELREAGDTIASYPASSSSLLPASTQQLLDLQTHQPPAHFHNAFHYPPSLGEPSQHILSLQNLLPPSPEKGPAENAKSRMAYSSPIHSPEGIQGDVANGIGNAGNKVGGNGLLAEKSEDAQGLHLVFPCTHPDCNKSFTRLYNLKSHLRTHTNERPFQCDECPSTFTRNHDLRRHKKVHSGDKPFCCEGCGRQFGRMDALSRHRGNKPGCQRQADDSNFNMSSSQPQNEQQALTAVTERPEIPFNPDHLQQEEEHPSPQQSHSDHHHTISHSTQSHLHQPLSQVPTINFQHQSTSVAVGYEDHGIENKDLHLLQQQLQAQHEQHQKQLQGGRKGQERKPRRIPGSTSRSSPETRHTGSKGRDEKCDDEEPETRTPPSTSSGEMSGLLLEPTDEDGCMALLDL